MLVPVKLIDGLAHEAPSPTFLLRFLCHGTCPSASVVHFARIGGGERGAAEKQPGARPNLRFDREAEQSRIRRVGKCTQEHGLCSKVYVEDSRRIGRTY